LASVAGHLKGLDRNRDATDQQMNATAASFIFALILAILVGWLSKKSRRIGSTILGATTGFFGGFLLYTTFLIQYLEDSNVLFTIYLIMTLVGAF
jgi:energy-converting hydrogenase Eha subunit F